MNPKLSAYLETGISIKGSRFVAIELIRMLDNADVSMQDVGMCISKDQALLVKVLRLANSSFFGVSGRVGTVQEAMTVLGMQTIRKMAISLGMVGAFSESTDLKAFWKHCLQTALNADYLATMLDFPKEVCYVAGLFCDIGLLFMYEKNPDLLKAALHWEVEEAELLAHEREILGFDHAELGEAMSIHWHLPDCISYSIANHHSEDAWSAGPISAIVYCADRLTHAMLAGKPFSVETILPASMLAFLRLDEAQWQELVNKQAVFAQQAAFLS
ncbi:HDOD domain-containing protein [Leeia sp.]|uniref:HDOD domain-containing protein n=1 Tax=Leeia sp. TaxID=2884678 RepID=UPI0035B498C1